MPSREVVYLTKIVMEVAYPKINVEEVDYVEMTRKERHVKVAAYYYYCKLQFRIIYLLDQNFGYAFQMSRKLHPRLLKLSQNVINKLFASTLAPFML